MPRDHDGVGIVCPSCRRILRIPGAGDASAELMKPIHKIGFSTEPEPKRNGRGNKPKKVIGAVVPTSEIEKGYDWYGLLKTVAVWGISFAVVIGGVFLFLKHTEPEHEEFEIDPDVGKTVLEVPTSLLAGEE